MAGENVLQQWAQQAKEAAAPVVQAMRDAANSHHAAPVWAEWRRGLKDVQDVVLQAFPDSHRSRDEPGSIGSPTMQEVFLNKTGRELQIDMGR